MKPVVKLAPKPKAVAAPAPVSAPAAPVKEEQPAAPTPEVAQAQTAIQEQPAALQPEEAAPAAEPAPAPAKAPAAAKKTHKADTEKLQQQAEVNTDSSEVDAVTAAEAEGAKNAKVPEITANHKRSVQYEKDLNQARD